MKTTKLFKNFVLALCCCLILVNPALALKSDRDQPADIQADDIEFDFQKGTRTYLNNVLAVQGTLRLKADKLIANYKDGQLSNATIWGNLARFKQRPDDKPYDVEGWAKKIVVDQEANTLTLVGQATLQQGPDTARGDTIIYNMANDTLKVRGGAKIGSGGTSGQARPNKKLEDPFKDDKGPPAAPKSVRSATDEANTSTDTENVTPSAEVQAAPAGRSRLIIRPKKKTEQDTDNDDTDNDDTDNDDTQTDGSNTEDDN